MIDYQYPYSVVWNKLFRAEVIQGLRVRPYPIAQDLDYTLRSFMHFRRAICCRQKMYYWYSHDGQVTKKAHYYLVLPDIYYTSYVKDFSGKCSFDYVILGVLYKTMARLKVRSINTEDRDALFQKCKHYYKLTISNYLHEKRIPVKEKAKYIFDFHFPYLAYLLYGLFERYPMIYKRLKLK